MTYLWVNVVLVGSTDALLVFVRTSLSLPSIPYSFSITRLIPSSEYQPTPMQSTNQSSEAFSGSRACYTGDNPFSRYTFDLKLTVIAIDRLWPASTEELGPIPGLSSSLQVAPSSPSSQTTIMT
jgi:hypothetical protein